MQQALAAPFVIDQKEVFAVVSFGLALSPPDDIDVLLRRADVALRRAKSAGRGQTVVFEREQGTESVHRLHYAGEVRRAIARGEIVAHYQPVVDLATGRAVGVEALARWDHPDRGRIPPDLFIPVAESTGLIGELGDRILEQACADAVRWLERGRRLQLAVNASAVQLMDPAFPDRVAATLRNQGMSPQQLAIEVTETAALRDRAALQGRIREADLAIRVVGEDEGRALNRHYRGKDYATNVLSFPADMAEGVKLPEGVRVPTGFATTAHAFRQFLAHDGLADKINARLATLDTEDVRALAAAGAEIRAMVEAQPFPADLEKAIHEAFDAFIGDHALDLLLQFGVLRELA